MTRWIFFDSETTGLKPEDGHRVFEIGCVEVIDRVSTNRFFHKYVNPGRPLSPESMQICQIEDSFLLDKPVFAEIAEDLINFFNYGPNGEVMDTVLFAHNARFDVNFFNHEFSLCSKGKAMDNYKIIDTVKLAKKKFPSNSVSLDNLCKQFNISLHDRDAMGHGALLDSALLKDVVMTMCQGDSDDSVVNFDQQGQIFFGFHKRSVLLEPRVFKVSLAEQEIHQNMLLGIKSDIW